MLQILFLQKFHKCLGAKGVTLRADGKRIFFIKFLCSIKLLDFLTLFPDGINFCKEFLPFLGKGNAAIAACEDGNTHFLLQLTNGGGNGRLRNEQMLRCLVHGAAVTDFHDVFQL